MSRAKSSKSSPKKKLKSKGSASDVIDYSRLDKTIKEKTSCHGTSQRTKKSYEGHIRRAREFLQRFVADEKLAEKMFQAGESHGHTGDGEDEAFGGEENMSMDPEFVDAFTGPPRKCTPTAISMFIGFKCFHENLGSTTAASIHAAFVWHYDNFSDPLEQAPFFRINLRERKNWQRKMKNGELQANGHCYNIYPEPSDTPTPSIDLYKHLLNWLEFAEKNLLGRPWHPDDHVFFKINKHAHPDIGISPEAVGKMISEMASAAGIPHADLFTTHCFRRGGAQYRFMFAPVRRKWTLARIRWWGGWALGEKRDTLIRYLLDELYTYEEDHSDALNPGNYDISASGSHAGEIYQERPLTLAEGREIIGQFSRSVTQYIDSALEKVSSSLPTAPQPPAGGNSQHHCSCCSQRCPEVYQPSHFSSLHTHQAIASGHAVSQPNTPPFQALHDIHPLIMPSSTSTMPTEPQIPPRNSSDSAVNSDLPGVSRWRVPEIRRSAGANGWRQVVADWKFADPPRLDVALKDWKPEWYKKSGQGVLYGQRATIAREFITTFNENEEEFLRWYPEANKNLTVLFRAIQARELENGQRQHRAGRT
ncbi:hypothetical protein MD484_g3266, partial [Candolleomyces efflorescens]